jgi:hypothetical protein
LRTAVRERDGTDFLATWHAIWDEVEAYYFQHVCPPESFDLVIRNDDNAEKIVGRSAENAFPNLID